MYVSFKIDCSDEWQVLFMGSADLGSSIGDVHNVLGKWSTLCVCVYIF